MDLKPASSSSSKHSDIATLMLQLRLTDAVQFLASIQRCLSSFLALTLLITQPLSACLTMNPIFCIPQAIDSRSKVLVAGNDVHKKGAGATELNSVVESLVKDLKDASSKSETPDAATSGIPGDDQRAHVELGKEIRELASKPLRVLEKFRRDGTAKFRTWEAIRNGAKAVWYADLIEAAERYVDSLRSRMTLRLLSISRCVYV